MKIVFWHGLFTQMFGFIGLLAAHNDLNHLIGHSQYRENRYMRTEFKLHFGYLCIGKMLYFVFGAMKKAFNCKSVESRKMKRKKNVEWKNTLNYSKTTKTFKCGGKCASRRSSNFPFVACSSFFSSQVRTFSLSL